LVQADGASLAAVLADLEQHFPGIRFRMIDEQQRIRRHIRIFIGQQPATDLQHSVAPNQAVHLICALSGG